MMQYLTPDSNAHAMHATRPPVSSTQASWPLQFSYHSMTRPEFQPYVIERASWDHVRQIQFYV